VNLAFIYIRTECIRTYGMKLHDDVVVAKMLLRKTVWRWKCEIGGLELELYTLFSKIDCLLLD
jgi:hypothetical protein